MNIKELLKKNECSIFNVIKNLSLVNNPDGWAHYSHIKINSPIAMGWLNDDNILVINVDGVFVYDIAVNQISSRDFETDFEKMLSKDNLSYRISETDETCNIFGVRGGGGNLMTSDKIWRLDAVSLSWNVKVPRLLNNKTSSFELIELSDNSYSGYMLMGFSRSELFFSIITDTGIFVYKKMN